MASGLPTRKFSAIERLNSSVSWNTTPILRRSPVERAVADVDAVDLDEAGLRIEGAMQQRQRRRFAAAGRPDQRDGLAGQRGEFQIRDRGTLAVIGKRHVLEFDRAAHARRDRWRRAGRAPRARCRTRRKSLPSFGASMNRRLAKLTACSSRAINSDAMLMKLTISPTEASPTSFR